MPVCVAGAVGALVCSRSAGVCACLGVAVASLCLLLWCAVCAGLWQVLRCVVLWASVWCAVGAAVGVSCGFLWCCFVYKNQ